VCTFSALISDDYGSAFVVADGIGVSVRSHSSTTATNCSADRQFGDSVSPCQDRHTDASCVFCRDLAALLVGEERTTDRVASSRFGLPEQLALGNLLRSHGVFLS
jgi:hypothetical protein